MYRGNNTNHAGRGRCGYRGGHRGGHAGRGNHAGHLNNPPYQCRAQQLQVNLDALTPGTAVAIDCEGQTLWARDGPEKNGCGQFAAVTEDGTIIYDPYCFYPPEERARPPHPRFNLGVLAGDVRPENGAQPIAHVREVAKQIFERAGIIVGHAIHAEIQMLSPLDFTSYDLRDTQLYAWPNGAKGLAAFARTYLNQPALQNTHSAVDDARATMKLYLLHRKEMDDAQGSKPSPPASTGTSSTNARDATQESSHSEPSSNTSIDITTSSSRFIAPGSKVAIPLIAEFAYGREWDKANSVFKKKEKTPAEIATDRENTVYYTSGGAILDV